MSFVDTKIKLLLMRVPKPLPDNYNLVADVRSSEPCSKLLDSLQMRIALNTFEQATVKFPNGDCSVVNPTGQLIRIFQGGAVAICMRAA